MAPCTACPRRAAVTQQPLPTTGTASANAIQSFSFTIRCEKTHPAGHSGRELEYREDWCLENETDLQVAGWTGLVSLFGRLADTFYGSNQKVEARQKVCRLHISDRRSRDFRRTSTSTATASGCRSHQAVAAAGVVFES